MIQPHNRHMSFSLYICVVAVADTISLLIGRFMLYYLIFIPLHKLFVGKTKL